MKYGVGPQDAGQKGSWKDVATLGAQMLPGSDIAREVGASDLEPTISEDIKNKRYMDALLKAISTAGDVGTGTGAIMMGTGAGAVPGAALIGASQLAKLAAKAARKKPILYHTTDARKGIQGELKTGADLGFHLGGNAEISRNAAITTRRNIKDLKTEKFELDAKPEEILTLKRRGGPFEPDDFADEMLNEKFITKKEHSKLFDNILDLEEKYGHGNKEYYQAANRMYKKFLQEKNIKAIKYFNEVDAGPNKLFKDVMAKADIDDILGYTAILKGERHTHPRLKDLDLTDTGIDVKPADSYVIFDSSVIKKVPEIPEIAKDLNTTEAITGYIIDPVKLSRNQLITKIGNNKEIKTKTTNYLDEQGYGDTIPVYRIISVQDETAGLPGRKKIITKAEIEKESLISGSLTPEANLKTIKFFQDKGATQQQIVRYDVPRDKIKLTMGSVKSDITQNVNKKLKQKGFGQEKISGVETITNPSKSAKNLIDMQEEVIADVSGLKQTVLGSPRDLVPIDVNRILSGEIKTLKDFKNNLPSSFSYASQEDWNKLYNKKISLDEFRKIENAKTKEAFDKIIDFYGIKIKKNQGGMIMRDPYKREERFI